MKLELIKETKAVKNGHETVFFIEKGTNCARTECFAIQFAITSSSAS